MWDAISSWSARTNASLFAQTMGMFDVMNQICSGGVIAIDGDHATGHSTITELSKRSNFDKLEIFLGNYDDDLIRTPDGWSSRGGC